MLRVWVFRPGLRVLRPSTGDRGTGFAGPGFTGTATLTCCNCEPCERDAKVTCGDVTVNAGHPKQSSALRGGEHPVGARLRNVRAGAWRGDVIQEYQSDIRPRQPNGDQRTSSSPVVRDTGSRRTATQLRWAATRGATGGRPKQPATPGLPPPLINPFRGDKRDRKARPVRHSGDPGIEYQRQDPQRQHKSPAN